MASSLRIVCYAVNGSGVGHLVRLTAICRWLRRYTTYLGQRTEIYFLTSSEADSMLFHEQLASFKLPSKTVVGETGIDKLAYLSLAKQWVWHSLGLLRPDLLIVDTFPRGSFGELLSALDLCRHRAFIYRPVREDFLNAAEYQSILPLYDLTVVPELESDVPAAQRPASPSRLHYVGPVVAREPFERLSRAAARARLGVTDDRLLVYVSAGGGGDDRASEQLHAVCDALLVHGDVHLFVAAGPLYRGTPRYGERITWVSTAGTSELLGGVDLAVSAAGYNSFYELMQAGVPTLFMPQEKVADEQDRRAARAVAAGAGFMLPPVENRPQFAEAIASALAQLRSPDVRAQAQAAAQKVGGKNSARIAAAALLGLVLPADQVEAAEAAVTEDLLGYVRAEDTSLATFVEVMAALSPTPLSSLRADVARELGQAALALYQAARKSGVPDAALLRFLKLVVPKLGQGDACERAHAVGQFLAGLSEFRDWPGALALSRILQSERQESPAMVASELLAFLSALRRRGEDLYRGIAYLSQAQAIDSPPLGSCELLRTARVRFLEAA